MMRVRSFPISIKCRRLLKVQRFYFRYLSKTLKVVRFDRFLQLRITHTSSKLPKTLLYLPQAQTPLEKSSVSSRYMFSAKQSVNAINKFYVLLIQDLINSIPQCIYAIKKTSNQISIDHSSFKLTNRSIMPHNVHITDLPFTC